MARKSVCVAILACVHVLIVSGQASGRSEGLTSLMQVHRSLQKESTSPAIETSPKVDLAMVNASRDPSLSDVAETSTIIDADDMDRDMDDASSTSGGAGTWVPDFSKMLLGKEHDDAQRLSATAIGSIARAHTMWHGGDLFGPPKERDVGLAFFHSASNVEWGILGFSVAILVILDFVYFQKFSEEDFPMVPEEKEAQLKAVFDKCDVNGKKQIMRRDLVQACRENTDVAETFHLDEHIRHDLKHIEELFEYFEVGQEIKYEDLKFFYQSQLADKASKSSTITLRSHLCVLAFWVATAAVFNAIVFMRQGEYLGFEWLNGYALEWLLSMDNLFVFHLIFQIYNTPKPLLHKALFLGILGAAVFRMAFFMAISSLLHLVHWVRFVFGVLLIYSGIQAARDNDDEQDVSTTQAVSFLKSCLGSRLLTTYDLHTKSLFVMQDGKLCCTLLVPVIFCLELTDIVFAIDSVSAKVAQIPNYYIAYSSSVLAIFGLRAMFFIIRDLVDYFDMLKYGLCFILVFIGVELMVSDYVKLPAQVVCVVILSVFLVCVASSKLLKSKAIVTE